MLDLFAWLVPVSPLVGAAICMLMSLRGDRNLAHLPAIASLCLSALSAICLLVFYKPGEQAQIFEGYEFLRIASESVQVSLRIDTLTLTLLTVVTVVSALVCIYSREYMKDDPGYARYFAVFSAFVFSMTMLVLASNLILLYAFWEGVGTCSYLLIGYWFRKPSAAAAASKAFLVNRLADVAFFIGILLTGYAVGTTSVGAGMNVLTRFDFDTIFRAAQEIGETQPTLVYWIALCFITGAIGKSAQFPFHVWLPDAMEGPTPVSALIHAATMVTAGVYLTARMSPVLVYAPSVLVLVAYLGAITSVIAALMAMFQDDLKRVLAYSTVSQLGYLFMALGTASQKEFVVLAIWAAMFHLVTHAFFKALLFLSAGSVMHAMGDIIDMRKFSGLRKVLPRTHWMFLIGAATLAGFPLLSAFFSKETILGLLVDAGQSGEYGSDFKFIAVLGFVTAFMTAIYTSKSYFRTFWGAEKLPQEAGHHPHDAGNAMFFPMAVLSVGAILAGGLLGPTGWLLHYIELTPTTVLSGIEHSTHLWMVILSTIIALTGIGIGYVWSTMASDAPKMSGQENGLVLFAKERLYIDWVFHKLLVLPMQAGATAMGWIDEVIVNGLATALGLSPAGLGHAIKRLQSGRVSSYAAYTAIGIAALAVYLIVS